MELAEFIETMSVNQDVINAFAEVGVDNASAIRALLVQIYPFCKDTDVNGLIDYIQTNYAAGTLPEPTEEDIEAEYTRQEANKKINPLCVIFLILMVAGIFVKNVLVIIAVLVGTFLFCNGEKYNNWLKPIVIFVGIVGLLIMLASDINVNPTMFGDTVTGILNA